MKVTVEFEFEDVDPNSPEADKILRDIAESCETMRVAFNAQNCCIQNVPDKKFFDIEWY
jgi:hypothetical protein